MLHVNTTHALSVTTLCDCKLWIETYLERHYLSLSEHWKYKHHHHLCFRGRITFVI